MSTAPAVTDEEARKARVKADADSLGPLTDEQLAKLAVLLRPGAPGE